MPSTLAAIRSLLGAELTHLQAFSGVLGEEQSVLQTGKADALPEISQRKAALADELGRILAQRERILADGGLPAGRAGMTQWLQQLPPVEKIAAEAEWGALLGLAERCRTDHELNGKLIAIQLAHTQQALNALMTAGGQTLTYGPDGQQRIGGGRSLGSA